MKSCVVKKGLRKKECGKDKRCFGFKNRGLGFLDKKGFFIFLIVGMFFVGIVFAATPIINSIILTSSYPAANSTSQYLISSVNATDGDGDNLTYIYTWYLNDSVISKTLIEAGLVAYFPFDNDIYDYFSDNDGGQFYNESHINISAGKKDGALILDGEDNPSGDPNGDEDHIIINSSKLTSLNSNMSISFWASTSSTKTYQTIVNVKNNATQHGYNVKFQNGNKLHLTFIRDDDSDNYRCDNTPFSLGAWHHFMITYDHFGNATKYYIDGQEYSAMDCSDIRTTSAIGGAHGYNQLAVGSAYNDYGIVDSFNGSIDELMIFDKYLSSEEAGLLYNGSVYLQNITPAQTSVGDIWKLGVKVADNSSISVETNSSNITIYSALFYSDTTPQGLFNYSINVSLEDDGIVGGSYSFVDFNDTLAWWLSFDSTSDWGEYYNYSGIADTSFTSSNGLIEGVHGGQGVRTDGGTYYNIIHDWGYKLPIKFFDNQEFTVSTWGIINNENNTLACPLSNPNTLFVLGRGPTTSSMGTNCTGFGAYYRYNNGNGAVCYGTELTDLINYDEWVMITMVYDRGTIKAYVNGSIVGSYSGAPAYTNSTYFIGVQGDPSARLYIGSYTTHASSEPTAMDEFIFFTRALSDEEVRFLYNSTDSSVSLDYYERSWDSGDNFTIKGYVASEDISYETSERNLTLDESGYLNLTDFLRENLVIQRNLITNTSSIILGGDYSSSYTGDILYSINGIEYSDMAFSNGFFSKNLSLGIGRYNISVYFEDYPLVSDSVNGIGAGDVIVVLGQSNSNIYYSALRDYYTPKNTQGLSFSKVNGYNGTNWTYLSNFDISSTNNMWFPLMDSISHTQEVPVMMISGSIGGSGVGCWANTTDVESNEKQCYIGLLSQLNNLTYNNDVYGVVYHQGENDVGSSSFKTTWRIFLTNLLNDVNISSEKIILGNIWSNSYIPNYPQKSIQEIWSENSSEGVFNGAYVYDMNTTATGGTVHFYTIANEGWPFVNRWKTAGLYNFYGYGDMKIPNLNGVYVVNSTRIDMVYDRALIISDFLNNSGNIAWGLQLYNDTGALFTRSSKWNMSHVFSTELDNNTISYYFTENISDVAEYSYCINTYCNNKSIVRDAISEYPSSFPPLMVYPSLLNESEEYSCGVLNKVWYEEICYNDLATACSSNGLVVSGNSCVTSASTSGGGTPTYNPTESNIQQGYSKQLGKSWKLKFTSNEEEHQLKLDSFNPTNKTATITISSKPQTKTLSVGEEWKVNLDGDDNYDLLVRLENVTTIRANVFIMEIDEGVVLESGAVVKENEEVDEEVVEDKPKTNWFLFIGYIILVIVLLGGAFLIWRKYLLKK